MTGSTPRARRIHLDSKLQHYPEVPAPAASFIAPEKFKQVVTSVHDRYFKQKSPLYWLEEFLPVVQWLRTYAWKPNISDDIIAGLTVAAVVVPQGISYALLAGMPVEYGLYCSLVPVYVYFVFGTSKQAAVGTSAMSSLTFQSVVMPIVNPTNEPMTDQLTQEYVKVGVQVAFLVGIIFLAMGILRLGFITSFFSKAVLSGFVTGAAVIIILSQMKYILGIHIAGSNQVQVLLKEIFTHLDEFNWKSFVVGISSIAIILSMKQLGLKCEKVKWIKPLGPVTVCILTILLSWLLDFAGKGIPTVGYISGGLPPASINQWTPFSTELIVPAFTLVIVGFIESIGCAQKFAAKYNYEINSSKEFFALGAANLFGSMCSVYPVVNSLCRTAVNDGAGAKSQISALITATGVLIVLLWLLFLFSFLPMCVLGAIVITGVLGLFEFGEFIFLWKVHKLDCITWIVSFCVTMFVSVLFGVLSALVLSLLILQYESARPHTAILGRLPNSTVYRDVKQYSEATQYPGMVLCRIDAPLYFANSQYIREKLEKYITLSEEKMEVTVSYVIVDISAAGYIDSTALHTFQEIAKNFKKRDFTLCFCSPTSTVMKTMIKSGVIDAIGDQNVFSSEHHAVSVCRGRLNEGKETLADVESGDDIMPSGVEEANDPGSSAETLTGAPFDEFDETPMMTKHETTSKSLIVIQEDTEENQ